MSFLVMGGRSESQMQPSQAGFCIFTGNLSLENNGGFASIRRDVAPGTFTGAAAVRLRVRGDGNTYQFRIRASSGFNSPSYQVEFPTTAGEWTDVTLDIADFECRWRGRMVRDAKALDPAEAQGIGLLIANKQTGRFQLEVAQLNLSR